jgi:hypothetical protein
MLRALLICLAIPAAALAKDDLQHWRHKHAAAAQALGDWVKKNPRAAQRLFAWDGLHPDRTKSLVDWALSNPDEDVVAFHTKHQDWPEFQELLDKHRLELNDFAAWCRQHRDAAKALMDHPRALEWAGKNLYAKKRS